MKILATFLALTTVLASGTTLAGPGEDTVNAMNARLADQRVNCGALSMPAVLCTGVIARATDDPRFWVPQEKNITSGAISASYLRNDAKFKTLVFGRNRGFTLLPVLLNRPNNQTYEVLCAFPNDGGTDNRNDRGCGDHVLNPEVQDYCDVLGIMTGDDWNKRFRSDKVLYSEICAFDIRDRRDAHAGPAFMASIDARNLGGETLFAVQNELRIATWGNNPPFDPPVESVFYTTPPVSDTSGLEGARAEQIEWWLAARQYLPLVKLNLPQTMAANPSFGFDTADQVIQPVSEPDQCPGFIKSSAWKTERKGAYFATQLDSLQVELNDCAKTIPPSQLNNLFNEIAARHYRDEKWGDHPVLTTDATQNAALVQAKSYPRPTHIVSGMRAQLACQLALPARPAIITLEPKRPEGTTETLKNMNCNL
ncbi:hypothetical protein [Pseudomonas putida]|uniref:hypothetical protein n=1 Tax=Pseudomonas putida TaxID=303 RepID=UPI000A4C7066|nr:hypothetical protein [Pseudomonas putida]